MTSHFMTWSYPVSACNITADVWSLSSRRCVWLHSVAPPSQSKAQPTIIPEVGKQVVKYDTEQTHLTAICSKEESNRSEWKLSNHSPSCPFKLKTTVILDVWAELSFNSRKWSELFFSVFGAVWHSFSSVISWRSSAFLFVLLNM